MYVLEEMWFPNFISRVQNGLSKIFCTNKKKMTESNTISKFTIPTNLGEIQPCTYWKKGKNPGFQLKFSEPGSTYHAKLVLPPLQVTRAFLGEEGDGCGQFSVWLKPCDGLAELCNRAMKGAYADPRVFSDVPRDGLEKFLENANYSVLKCGVYATSKLYRGSGRTSQPHFFNTEGEEINPASIPPGSVIQVILTLSSFNGTYSYGVGGNL